MTILPSPIPHPLDFSPWDLPGWAYEALEWVVGFDWPEGDEKAVWDVADQWYELVSAMAAPREDAADAAARFVAAYGGSGTTIDSFIAAWKAVADGDEAPLNALVAFAAEMGEIVDECAQDIEAAKLEAWIELGIFVIELIGLAVTVALTLGAASPAAAGIIAATRIAIQQIFKRLVAQLSRKAVKQSLKEAGQRAAKDLLTRKGLTSFSKRALREGAEEAREEALTNLAVQGYQAAVGHSDGIDLAELGRSTLAGAAGGVSAHGASIGAGHRSGIVRGATAEVFGEVGGAAAMGDLPGFSDLAKAGTSGAAGSAIGNTRHSFQEMGANLDAGNGLRLDDLPTTAPSSTQSGTDLGSAFSGLPSDSPMVGSGTSGATAGGSVSSGGSLGGSAGTGSPTVSPTVSNPAELSPAASTATGHHGDHSTSPPSVTSPVATAPADAPAPDSTAGTHQATVTPLSSDVTLSSAAPPAEAPAHGATNTGAQTPPSAPAAVNSNTTAVTAVPAGAVVTTTSSIAGAPAAGTAGSPPLPTPGPAPTTGPTSFTSPHPNVSLPGGGPATAAPSSAAVGTTTTERGLSTPSSSSAPAPAQPATSDQRPPQTTPPRPDAGINGLPLPGGAHAAPHLTYRTPEQARHEQEYFDQYGHNKQAVENDLRAKEAMRWDIDIQQAQLNQKVARRAALRAALLFNFAEQKHQRQMESFYRKKEAFARSQRSQVATAPLPDVNLPRSPYHGIANTEYAYLTRSDLPVYGSDRSALTGSSNPANTRTSRPYGRPGGLREPLRLHQADLEMAVPRDHRNMPVRTPDPRGPFLRLINDGGPTADPTRGFNCLDCSLSFYETYVHGRPTVSAPRTVDGYRFGGFDMHGGESGGPDRAEIATGSTFTAVTPHDPNKPPAAVKADIDRGFEKIVDTLQRGGHGSTAIIINVWEGGDSHAWNAVNHHGSVLFLDPQSGEYADPANFVPGPAKFPTLYGHTGVQDPSNVVALHTLMVDGRGDPMAVANTPHTGYNQGTTPIPPSPPPLQQQQVSPRQPLTPPPPVTPAPQPQPPTPPVTPSPAPPSPAPPVHPHPPGPQIHTAPTPVPVPPVDTTPRPTTDTRPENGPPITAPRVNEIGRTVSEQTSPQEAPAPSREVLDPLAVLDPDAMRQAAEPDSRAVPEPDDDPRPAAAAVEDRSAAEQRAREDYHYEIDRTRRDFDAEFRRRTAQELRRQADATFEQAERRQDAIRNAFKHGDPVETARYEVERDRLQAEAESLVDRARLVEGGGDIGDVELTGNDWERVNDTWSDLAPGPVETGDRSALTGDDRPRSIDTTRRYHHRGGLRPPLRIHQTDLERAMPRDVDGAVIRLADPRDGDWFGLINDGGPEADPTRAINCGDTVLSLFDTYMHGRPRVSAPRTFDGYSDGDPTRPIGAERGVSARIEAATGGRFEGLVDVGGLDPDDARVQVRTAEIRLRSHLTDLGHGSFAFITTQDQAGRTHMFAAVNQHGTVLYLDPQTRRVSAHAPIHTHSGLGAPCDVLRMDTLVVDGRAVCCPIGRDDGPQIAQDPAGRSRARHRSSDDEPKPMTSRERWLAGLAMGSEVEYRLFEGCPVPVTSKVTTDEHGTRVVRHYIDDVDDLLEVADFMTGGRLGVYEYLGEDYFEGRTPDGVRQKIEVNPIGHYNTGEGPHIKLMVLREPELGAQGGWKVDEKVFIKYRERLPRRG